MKANIKKVKERKNVNISLSEKQHLKVKYSDAMVLEAVFRKYGIHFCEWFGE
jgi:hypothetical protein